MGFTQKLSAAMTSSTNLNNAINNANSMANNLLVNCQSGYSGANCDGLHFTFNTVNLNVSSIVVHVNV